MRAVYQSLTPVSPAQADRVSSPSREKKAILFPALRIPLFPALQQPWVGLEVLSDHVYNVYLSCFSTFLFTAHLYTTFIWHPLVPVVLPDPDLYYRDHLDRSPLARLDRRRRYRRMVVELLTGTTCSSRRTENIGLSCEAA